MKGGTIKAESDGTIVGMNETGDADAILLRALNITWNDYKQTPDLRKLYEFPNEKINGFNKSFENGMRDFIRETFNEDVSMGKSTISLYLDIIITMRSNDAKKHQNKGAKVNRTFMGHSHIYALARWLSQHYIPDWSYNGNNEIDLETKNHFVNVYRQEYETRT